MADMPEKAVERPCRYQNIVFARAFRKHSLSEQTCVCPAPAPRARSIGLTTGNRRMRTMRKLPVVPICRKCLF